MSEQVVLQEPVGRRRSAWLNQNILQPLSRSSAAWFYALLWLTAAGYLATKGYGVAGSVLFTAGMLLFCLFTVAITEAPPPPPTSFTPRQRLQLALQALVTFSVIFITGYTSLAFHGLITGQQAFIPIWTPLINWFADLGMRLLNVSLIGSPANALANPASYFLLPLPILLLLGARWRSLGLGRGHRTGRVVLLWCFIPVSLWLIQLATGSLSLFALVRRLVGHTLQNGPFEEFLFRGALQSRLAHLLTTPWALVIQALVFGAWHLGLTTRDMGGDVVAGLALAILSQSVFGLAMGIIFWRTRNLVASSAVHVALNTLG
jgi:membrane protease YdiL (CAAX protease family)